MSNTKAKNSSNDAAKSQASSAAKQPAQPKPAATSKDQKAPKTEKVAVVYVVGPANGRRRIGERFGPEKRALPLEGLSPKDLAALKDDPLLIVSEGEEER